MNKISMITRELKGYYGHLTVDRCLSQPLFNVGVFNSYTLIFVNAASTY